ncbi:MAG: hypothetical protein GX750_09445 [Clostridia bacterium]|nr:hypothetical protein [Clostridia bacterium]
MDQKIMELVAGLMALSARTAPKAAGKDFVEIKVVTGAEVERLAETCVAYGKETGKKNWDRDGENIRQSAAVLLLALKKAQAAGLNCGACGFAKCSDLPNPVAGPEFAGPICAWRIMDLGIALGSAAKTASILNADNRIMYRVGVAARQLNLIEGELVVGIPLSATGKSIYFDR